MSTTDDDWTDVNEMCCEDDDDDDYIKVSKRRKDPEGKPHRCSVVAVSTGQGKKAKKEEVTVHHQEQEEEGQDLSRCS